MYSPSSSSSDSSHDSYDRRRRRHRSKSRKAHTSRYDDAASKYSKESKKLSPLLQRYASDLSERSHRKKRHSQEDECLSRKELSHIKRQHEKRVLKFLERESSLLNGIEEDKREELHELKRQHEKEVRKLFEFQETEIALLMEKHDRKQAELEDRLERAESATEEEVRKYKDQVHTLEGNLELATKELKSTMQTSMHEMRTLKDDLVASERKNISLENEMRLLREKLAGKDAQIRQLEGMNSKSSIFAGEELRDVTKQKDRGIRPLTSRRLSSQENLDSININGCDWEETSGLTSSSDFDLRREADIYKDKSPMKYEISFGSSRRSHSSSILRDARDDSDTKRLTVSFSDEVEKRMLPMRAHDNLSRRLEKMYLPRSR